MQVTLIRPPAYSVGLMGAQRVPFLGIAYIAASIRNAGYTVDIVDMCAEDISRAQVIERQFIAYGMPFSSLKARIKPSQVIGISSTFSQDWVFHRQLIKYLRGLFPDTIIVAGGEHITALPEYCLQDCPELDICVAGEAEEVFVKLLQAIEKGRDLSSVPSLIYRNPGKDGFVRTPRSARIKDIDNIPAPAWDLTPIEVYLSLGLNYHIKRGRTIPMLATRGCPYRCSFCSNFSMWGNQWIARRPESVADEMQEYIRKYRAENFVFSDLTVVVSREHIVKLCREIIKRKINVTWQLPTLRTEALNREVMQLMYKAGCRELDFAIESASIRVLESVHKKNEPEHIISLIRDGIAVGMNLSVNMIVGLPDEGLIDFLKSYLLVIRLALAGLPEINVFPFVPYPGSQLFQELLDKKKVVLNDDYFFSLFGYANLFQAVSWSPRFGARTLNLMRILTIITFYGLAFLSRPWRLLRFMFNVLSNRPATKFEGVILRIFKNIISYLNPVNYIKAGHE